MEVKSDPPPIKLRKITTALLQNLGFCSLLTVAYLSAPLVGINDLTTNTYLLLMAVAVGLNYTPRGV